MSSAALESKISEGVNDEKENEIAEPQDKVAVCCFMSSFLRNNRWSFFEQCLNSITHQDMTDIDLNCVRVTVFIGYYAEDTEIEEVFNAWVAGANFNGIEIRLQRFEEKLTQFEGYRVLSELITAPDSVPDFVFFSDDDDLWHRWRVKYLVRNIQEGDSDWNYPTDIVYSLGLVKNPDPAYQPASTDEVDHEWHTIVDENQRRNIESISHPPFDYVDEEVEAEEYHHCCAQLGEGWRAQCEKRAFNAQKEYPVEHFQIALKFPLFRQALRDLQPLIDTKLPSVDLYFVDYINGNLYSMLNTADSRVASCWDKPKGTTEFSHWLYFYRQHSLGGVHAIKHHSTAHAVLFPRGAVNVSLMSPEEALSVKVACEETLAVLGDLKCVMYPPFDPEWMAQFNGVGAVEGASAESLAKLALDDNGAPDANI